MSRCGRGSGLGFCYLFCSFLRPNSLGFGCFRSVFGFHVVCRGLPGGNSLFFCFAKSKVSKRKGDPQSGPLRGSLKKLKEPENLETSLLRSRQTSKFFNPSPSTFSSPARTGWGKVRIRGCPHPNPLPQGEGIKTKLVARLRFYSLSLWERAGVRVPRTRIRIQFPQTLGEEVRSAGKSGSGHVLSERSEFARDPTLAEHRSVPAAKRRDDEQGRLFFGYFLLAIAKRK